MSIFEVLGDCENKLFAEDDDLINLVDLKSAIEKSQVDVACEEAIITPYYVDLKKYELYHYELLVCKGITFNDYILKKTGKKSADEISEKIVGLRKKCFISLDENDDIKCQVLGFFDFLLNDKALEEEIVSVFGSFSIENLYIEIF